MPSRRLTPSLIALLAGCALSACASLPDPSHPGKARVPDRSAMSRPEILAGVVMRVARNAEEARDWEAAHMLYARAHVLDKSKTAPLMGMGRTMLALNKPLDASEAYGAALALDGGNTEARAGLNRSLDKLALQSSRKLAGLPAATSIVSAEEGPPVLPVGDAAPSTVAAGAPASGFDAPAAETPAGSALATVPGPEGPRPATGESAPLAPETTVTRVDMNEVLAAIEAKEVPAAGPREGAGAAETAPRQVASAVANAAPTGMAGTPAAPVASGEWTGAGYRLQLSASSSKPNTVALRDRVRAKAKDLLGGIPLKIEEYPGGKKPVYKLRTAVVGSRQDAARLCGALQERAFTCFLVEAGSVRQAAQVTLRPTVTASADPLTPVPAPADKGPADGKEREKDKTAATTPKETPPAVGWEIVDTTPGAPGVEVEGESGEQTEAGAEQNEPAETADAGAPGEETMPVDETAPNEPDRSEPAPATEAVPQ